MDDPHQVANALQGMHSSTVTDHEDVVNVKDAQPCWLPLLYSFQISMAGSQWPRAIT